VGLLPEGSTVDPPSGVDSVFSPRLERPSTVVSGLRPPRSQTADRRSRLVTAISVNAVPLAGVVLLDWSLTALLAVYWVELGVGLCYAAIRGLFAQRPPEGDASALLLGAFQDKRGGVSVPGTDLRIQVANVPIVAVALPVFGFVWLFLGGVGVGAVAEASANGSVGDRAAFTVGLGIVAAVVGHGYETLSEYFLADGYESTSVQRAIWSGVWPVFVVGSAMAVGGAATAAGVAPTVALGATLGAKLLFDLADVYRDRLVAFDERDQVDLGLASDPPEWSTVETDLRPPVETARSNRAVLVVDGVVRGVSTPFVLLVGGLVSLLALLALVDGSVEGAVVVGGAVAALVAVFAAVGVADRSVRYLTVEYRVGEDVVGFDRLLGEPQWRVSRREIRQCERRRTVADRVFGTVSFVIEREDREVRIPYVDEAALIPGDRITDSSTDSP